MYTYCDVLNSEEWQLPVVNPKPYRPDLIMGRLTLVGLIPFDIAQRLRYECITLTYNCYCLSFQER